MNGGKNRLFVFGGKEANQSVQHVRIMNNYVFLSGRDHLKVVFDAWHNNNLLKSWNAPFLLEGLSDLVDDLIDVFEEAVRGPFGSTNASIDKRAKESPVKADIQFYQLEWGDLLEV